MCVGHLVGCGKLLPYCKLKVIDEETGEKLGPGQVGHVCVYSPYMMREYLNRPEETQLMIRDGWCHTGDKGYYDADENIFIIGRYKELIKYRMANVVPSNIEKHMLTHEAVEDVGVVVLAHDIDGEWPLAFVVLTSGCTITAQELIAYTNGKIQIFCAVNLK